MVSIPKKHYKLSCLFQIRISKQEISIGLAYTYENVDISLGIHGRLNNIYKIFHFLVLYILYE